MFSLTFNTDNASFADGPPRYEIFKVLTRVGTVVSNDPDARNGGVVRDTDGNTIGKWDYLPDLDDSGDDDYSGPDPATEARERITETIERQGWDAATVETILRDFVLARCPSLAADYLAELAREENTMGAQD